MAAAKQSGVDLAAALMLAAAVCALFWQVTANGFINYDDPRYVTENAVVRQGLTLPGIRWALSDLSSGNWHPLTWISHMLDWQLSGAAPRGHHLSSLGLHALNAGLVYLILFGLTGARGRCLAAAALFGLHPLRVESVAWVAERKDVLCAALWLLGMLAYLWYVRRPCALRYLVTALLCCLALAAKPMAVTLPAVLLLIDWWPLGRLRAAPRRCLLEKAPLLIAAVLVGMLTYTAQSRGGAVGSIESFSLPVRAAGALTAWTGYLYKTLLPVDLAVFYPHPGMPSGIHIVLSAALFAGLWIMAMRRAASPYILFGLVWYSMTLLPVSGLVQVGAQAMADRYTYLPSIGLCVLAAWSLAAVTEKAPRLQTPVRLAAGTVLLLFALLSCRQIGYWRDSAALFQHALNVTERNYVAHNNLGSALFERGDLPGARDHFAAAAEIYPGYAEAYSNLGNVLAAENKPREAVRRYRRALELAPRDFRTHSNLGLALSALGDTENAARHCREALRLQPEFAEAHYNLGLIYTRQSMYREAIASYRAALRLKPCHAKAHNNLGMVLAKTGDTEKALAHFRRALSCAPGYAMAQKNLTKLLQALQQ